VFLIWEGGLVMYGGFLGAVLLGLWSSRKHALERWNAVDTCMVAAFVGLAVGRIGCFLVGDDYGSLVPEEYAHLPFPITLEVPQTAWLAENPQSLFPARLAGEKLWATQLWMCVNATLVALIGWFVLKRRSWRGQVAGTMVVLYAITRFVIEMFRGDDIRGVWFGDTLSTSQLISIGGLALGIFLLVKRPGPAVTEPAPRARLGEAPQ